MKYTFTLFILAISFFGDLTAQDAASLDNIYKANIPLHQETISGGFYLDPPPTIEGDPYLFSKHFELGDLTINGIFYANVPLLYNIYTDEIVTFHPEHKQRVLIKTEKINAFSIHKKPVVNFIKIAENPGYGFHGNGFYEVLDSGKAILLSKHYKTRKEKKEISKYTSSFVDKEDFWLQMDGNLRPINKRKDVIQLLGVDKKEIKTLANERNLIYRTDKRSYLQMVLGYYNQL